MQCSPFDALRTYRTFGRGTHYRKLDDSLLQTDDSFEIWENCVEGKPPRYKTSRLKKQCMKTRKDLAFRTEK